MHINIHSYICMNVYIFAGINPMFKFRNVSRMHYQQNCSGMFQFHFYSRCIIILSGLVKQKKQSVPKIDLFPHSLNSCVRLSHLQCFVHYSSLSKLIFVLQKFLYIFYSIFI